MKNKIVLINVILSILIVFLYRKYNIREYYNNNLYLSKSNIEGVGVFCNKDYQINQQIFKAIENDKNITEIGRKINHCNNPNTSLHKYDDGWYIVASKNINKNTELTVDYTYTPDFIRKPDPNWKC
jgi:hypothetical protein